MTALTARVAAVVRVPQSPQEIDDAIARLSADQWRDRRDAMESLIAAGPVAEFRVARLVDQTPIPEARIRGQRILRQVRQVRRTEPALVTLTLHDANAAAAFEKLAEIEGAELRCDPPDLFTRLDATVSISFDHTLYWRAALSLCERFSLELRCGDEGVRIVRKSATGAAQVSYGVSGTLLICGKLARWSDNPRDPGRTLRIEAYPEPRADLFRGDPAIALRQVTDQHGQSLLPPGDAGASPTSSSGSRGTGYQWNVPLRPVALPDTTLSRVGGTMRVVLAERIITVETPDPPGGKTLTGSFPINLSGGGIAASVQRIIPVNNTWDMDLQLDTDPAAVDWDGLLASMQNGRLRVWDIDGSEMTIESFWRAGAGPSNDVRIRWGGAKDKPAPRPGAPYRLVWQMPARTITVAVPFELLDVKVTQ